MTMPRIADLDVIDQHDATSRRVPKDQESTSKLTVATAPLTPPIHGAIKDAYDKGVPTSASTLSSAASLEANQNALDDTMDDPIPSSCSSPYEAFLFSSEWLGSRELQLQLPDMISRSSSQGIPNDDNESVASGAYFEPVDLDSSNWMKAIRMDGPTFGFALVALATAVVHPVLFVAGALTAFGTLHAVGAGYEYCKKESSEETAASWENSMLSICFKEAPPEPPSPDKELEGEQEPQSAGPANSSLLLPTSPAIKVPAEEKQVDQSQKADVATATNTVVQPLAAEQEATPAPVPQAKSDVRQRKESLSKELVEQAYPPLDNTVVKGVKFPGLHAIEFFRVFFADDAPYNFMELQKQRGDLDIVYGKWQKLGPDQPVSLHNGQLKQKSKTPIALEDWKQSFQGRVLNFRAKTNNFIGPVYATTRKTQRVLLHHKTMIVMESRTDLSDIPFCDRFYVLERWIVRAEKVQDEAGSGKYKYVSTLHATSQVVLTASCQFASQIKSKSASTIQDLVKCWCTMAKEALKLTEQRKVLRLKHEQEGESESNFYETDLEEEHTESEHQADASKENTPPPAAAAAAHEEEGIEVTWPHQDAAKENVKTRPSRPDLRHSDSAPLPVYRGRALQGFRRSVSSLFNNRR